MENPEYSIIIPAYNESERICSALDQVLEHIAKSGWHVEVIVVNDGSRDRTAEIVRGYAAQHSSVRLVENPGNRGKGYSVRNGMMAARGTLLLFSDADLSAPIWQADRMFDKLRNGADVVIGSRWMDPRTQTGKQPRFRQLASRVFNLLLRLILGLDFKDTQCGFKAFTRRSAEIVFSRQRIERWGFDPEILFIARRFGLRVHEIPVEWAHDDRSKISPVADGIRMFTEMLRIRWYDLTGKYSSEASALNSA